MNNSFVQVGTAMEELQQKQSPDHFKDVDVLSKHLLRPGISPEESQKLYNLWASQGTYDKMAEQANYFAAHDKLLAAVLELFPTRRDISILDVGAGTGLIGKRLHDAGFGNVDALDPSSEMLKEATKKGVYRRYMCCFFTGQPTCDISDDAYDLLVMCGVCGPGAVPVEAFAEAVRILKPGGYIINCMRAEYLNTCPEYRDRWQPFMANLISEGSLSLISEHRYPNHYFHHEGIRLVYQVP